jgi:hypothetical protein
MRAVATTPDSASLHPGYDAVIASGAKQSRLVIPGRCSSLLPLWERERIVARMERSEIRESMRAAPTAPDCASLHPGYDAVIASGATRRSNPLLLLGCHGLLRSARNDG